MLFAAGILAGLTAYANETWRLADLPAPGLAVAPPTEERGADPPPVLFLSADPAQEPDTLVTRYGVFHRRGERPEWDWLEVSPLAWPWIDAEGRVWWIVPGRFIPAGGDLAEGFPEAQADPSRHHPYRLADLPPLSMPDPGARTWGGGDPPETETPVTRIHRVLRTTDWTRDDLPWSPAWLPDESLDPAPIRIAVEDPRTGERAELSGGAFAHDGETLRWSVAAFGLQWEWLMPMTPAAEMELLGLAYGATDRALRVTITLTPPGSPWRPAPPSRPLPATLDPFAPGLFDAPFDRMEIAFHSATNTALLVATPPGHPRPFTATLGDGGETLAVTADLHLFREHLRHPGQAALALSFSWQSRGTGDPAQTADAELPAERRPDPLIPADTPEWTPVASVPLPADGLPAEQIPAWLNLLAGTAPPPLGPAAAVLRDAAVLDGKGNPGYRIDATAKPWRLRAPINPDPALHAGDPGKTSAWAWFQPLLAGKAPCLWTRGEELPRYDHRKDAWPTSVHAVWGEDGPVVDVQAARAELLRILSASGSGVILADPHRDTLAAAMAADAFLLNDPAWCAHPAWPERIRRIAGSRPVLVAAPLDADAAESMRAWGFVPHPGPEADADARSDADIPTRRETTGFRWFAATAAGPGPEVLADGIVSTEGRLLDEVAWRSTGKPGPQRLTVTASAPRPLHRLTLYWPERFDAILAPRALLVHGIAPDGQRRFLGTVTPQAGDASFAWTPPGGGVWHGLELTMPMGYGPAAFPHQLWLTEIAWESGTDTSGAQIR